MKYKKGLLAFCLIMAVFVCISCVAASDANDTATAGSDNINENAIAIEDNSEDVLNTDENPIEASDDDDAVVSESLITPYVSEISTDIEYDTGHAIFKLTDYYTDEPLEYVEVVNGENMQPIDTFQEGDLVAMAVRIGSTRLIDNFTVGDPKITFAE